MSDLRGYWHRLSALICRRNYLRDLDEEMAFHRDQMEHSFVANGMSPNDAPYVAKRQFGNQALLKERSHAAVGFRIETTVQDLRFAFRQLRRQPGFTLLAVAILSLGIGASVAIFAFLDAALLQPLPYVQPNRLLDVAESGKVHTRSNLSYLDYEDWKRLNKSFVALDAYTGGGFLLHSNSGVEPVPAARVTAGFFDTLGVRPLLGRTFRAGEDQLGSGKVVLLAYGTWVKRFGGRKDIIGSSLRLDDDNYTVIGVLPREFSFAPRGLAELWVTTGNRSPCEKRRSCHNLFAIGRLREGVTESSASADLKEIAAQLERMYPDSNNDQGASVQPLAQLIVGKIRPILFTLLGGSLLLLLIAVVNVSSLLLVRCENRRREIAVRTALGATHQRILRQFVTEGLLQATFGILAGLGVALWLTNLLTRLVPKAMRDSLPFFESVGLNTHTLGFVAGVAVLIVALLASTPTLRLGFQKIHEGLAEGGRGTAGVFWQRLGTKLVVVELATAVVLLTGAGLTGKSLYKLMRVDMGFDPSHLSMANVQLTLNPSNHAPETLVRYQTIQSKLGALPGVQSVALTDTLPVGCFCNTDWIRIDGKPFHGEHNEVVERDVTPNYLTTLKARLIRGRIFRDDEDNSKPTVTVINESLARKYFPGEDPIGKKIGDGSLSAKSMREVIGVIADVREGALDDEMIPGEYFSMYQRPSQGFTVLVRSAQGEKQVLPEMVNALHTIDPNMGVYGEISMVDQIESTQAAILHRFSTWLVGGFAFIAFILGVVGLYGVIAYSVSQRTREIGVRMALGAQRRSVYGMVMKQAAKLTAIGEALGLFASIGTSMLIRNLLFGVAAWDASTLGAVVIALFLAAMLASFVPAYRAASVSPTQALRVD
jgi:macrolide transport system ATP-binding/permease protein